MIVKACSYTAVIKTPVDPNEYSSILVTFAQGGDVLVEKTKASLEFAEDSVIVKLDQNDTKLFDATKRAQMQIRCYKSQYDAPGSTIFGIDVSPSLNEVVLS